uniref:Uncharacterized protein n=1 Tax=Parascaris univalens TaxID=6257 RepID=A0A915B3X1_PARUN
ASLMRLNSLLKINMSLFPTPYAPTQALTTFLPHTHSCT